MQWNKKLNLEVVPQGSLNHIAMESTLQDSIILAQSHDEGVKIIKQKLAQGDEKYKCFHMDHKGVLWFGNRIVVPKDYQLWRQIFDTSPSSLFILVVQRCTKTLDRIIGGPEWKGR